MTIFYSQGIRPYGSGMFRVVPSLEIKTLESIIPFLNG